MKSFSRQISCLILLAVFGLLTANMAIAEKTQEIYKWVDKDGRVHYAARPGDKSAKKMHLGSKIFHKQDNEKDKAKDNEQDEQREKLCNDSKATLAKYKKAPFLYRYDEERKQKVRLTENESKDAFLQAEKDVNYWCNPTEQSEEQSAEADTTETNNEESN